MSKRILITGASGLLGRACLAEFLQDASWNSIGLAFSRAGNNLQRIDLTDSQQVSDVVRSFKPSVILHCAAERRPDMVEKEEEKTHNLNIKATRHLCDLANEIGAFVLFVSTDYVFDGTKPPYNTSDETNPLNKYGLSKEKGEQVVLSANSGNAVIRVPVLYGEVEFLEESAVTILFTKVKDSSSSAKMNHREKRYPTLCSDLAVAFKILIESHLKNPEICGIFHWSGDEVMTKYDMAVAMAEVFGLPSSHLVADTEPALGAPRPMDSHLDSCRLEKLGATKRTPFREGIKQVLQKYCS